MHLKTDYILEKSQQEATLTDDDKLHLKQCVECASLFRLFVLDRLYSDRTPEQLSVECTKDGTDATEWNTSFTADN
jgi:hypothetical protein